MTIYEAAPQVGGLAAGFKAPHWDWTLEKFYHHWFATDSAILGLIDELGWRDQVLFPRPYTVAYVNGKFEPLDSPLMAMRFFLRNYPLIDMLRFGMATLYLRLTPWWQPLEKVTAADVDAALVRAAAVRAAVAAAAGGQVWRREPQRGEHGLAVGAAARAHHAAGHVHGRLSGVHGQAGGSGARRWAPTSGSDTPGDRHQGAWPGGRAGGGDGGRRRDV